MVSFGPRHRVVPNQNLGRGADAQRRLVEAAGRAAEKTRVSVSVDAWPCLLYLRNPRGTIPCPCSARGGDGSDHARGGTVVLDGGEGDDVAAIDAGYPLPNARAARDVAGAVQPAMDAVATDVGLAVQRMLMGNGRRCGICWGTGWIDGYRLWGGNRRIMCVSDAPGTSLLGGDADVDADAPTPTMVGPAEITWSVRVNISDTILDAVRVREGLLPSPGGYRLTVSNDGGDTFADPATSMSMFATSSPGVRRILPGTYQFRLVLADGARVSHVELVSRSEPLVNLQLPQLQQSASAELVAPFLNEEFELDPVVGYVERGSIIDVRPRDGRRGSTWMVTDVTVKQTSMGQIFGITGNAKNAQPTDVFAAASLDDDLRFGTEDPGYATRGLEGAGMGVPMGLGDEPDESASAARRGSVVREGGGRERRTNTIVLSTGDLES